MNIASDCLVKVWNSLVLSFTTLSVVDICNCSSFSTSSAGLSSLTVLRALWRLLHISQTAGSFDFLVRSRPRATEILPSSELRRKDELSSLILLSK